MEELNTIRISVDYNTHGYNKVVKNNSKDIIKTVLAALDSNVKEIVIKKEPTQDVPDKKN